MSKRKDSDQFNLEFERAKLERDRGMATAAAAEGAEFHVVAYSTLLAIARRQATVHIDDVLPEMKIRPQHFNAWGHVWMKAIRNKVIEHSGETRLCATDAIKQAHRYPVYRSLICGKSRFTDGASRTK